MQRSGTSPDRYKVQEAFEHGWSLSALKSLFGIDADTDEVIDSVAFVCFSGFLSYIIFNFLFSSAAGITEEQEDTEDSQDSRNTHSKDLQKSYNLK